MKGWHDKPQPTVTVMADGPVYVVIPRAVAPDGAPYSLPAVIVDREGCGHDRLGRIAKQAIWDARKRTDELAARQKEPAPRWIVWKDPGYQTDDLERREFSSYEEARNHWTDECNAEEDSTREFGNPDDADRMNEEREAQEMDSPHGPRALETPSGHTIRLDSAA